MSDYNEAKRKLLEISKLFEIEENEAIIRYQKYKTTDPFPEIPPALLHASDFIDYILTTGMIWPFDPNIKNLKPASYAIPFEGEYAYWDDKKNRKVIGKIEGKGGIILKSNSITYVTLKPIFRIPEYIALRFNLRIALVYQGLLVGTGPLVDPGFTGKIYLPIHNLTACNYTLKVNEHLIYMEFTKLSKSEKTAITTVERRLGDFSLPFSPEKTKNRKKLSDYLYLADIKGNPPRNSIPEVIKNIEKKVNEADARTRMFGKIGFWGGLGVIFGVIIAVVGVIVQMNIHVNSYASDTQEYIREIQNIQTETKVDLNKQVLDLKEQLILLESKLDSLKTNNE